MNYDYVRAFDLDLVPAPDSNYDPDLVPDLTPDFDYDFDLGFGFGFVIVRGSEG